MITIGIDLNHVVRNINRQLVKYYIKVYDPKTDISEVDDKEDVLSTYVKFDDPKKKFSFIYEDYPYEIFGCAEPSERGLGVKLNRLYNDSENIEEEDIRLAFFSVGELGLSIQSSYFFLSKLGSRFRKVIFPKNVDEVFDECDFVITANNEFFKSEESKDKCILINRPFNEESRGNGMMEYGNLSELIDDESFFTKIIDKHNGKNE